MDEPDGLAASGHVLFKLAAQKLWWQNSRKDGMVALIPPKQFVM
jgi:hypothetical protein